VSTTPLPTTANISGQCFKDDGSTPLSEAEINFFNELGDNIGLTMSDGNGNYEKDLPEGNITINVNFGGIIVGNTTINVIAGVNQSGVNVTTNRKICI